MAELVGMAQQVLRELEASPKVRPLGYTVTMRWVEDRIGKSLLHVIGTGSLRKAQGALAAYGYKVHFSTIRNWRRRLGIG